MSDSQALLVVLVLIYLSECCGWASKHNLVFQSWLGHRWRWTQPGRIFGNQDAGLFVRPVLPPLGTVFVSPVWPFSLSPHGCLAYVSHAPELFARPDQTDKFVAFDAQAENAQSEPINVTAVENQIHLNGQRFCKCSSVAHARHLMQVIHDAQQTVLADRGVFIGDALAEALDSSAVETAVTRFRTVTSSLRLLCNTLFLLLFVLFPVTITTRGISATWPMLLAVLLLQLIALDAVFFRTHRQLYPKLRGERWKEFLIVVLNPLAAIRAVDLLARPYLAAFHPLAVGHALLPTADFQALARSFLLDLRFPLPSAATRTTEADNAEVWYREKQIEALEEFLKRHGFNPADVAAPDPPESESCQAYCPRCQCQFLIREGTCTRCDIAIKPYVAGVPGS